MSNCDVESQDDACALFGSCRDVTVTNSTFSTRWSVFRFGGGNPENIVISNCVIHDTYGCPIKMQFNRESRVQNILFSNLVLQDVTGPISINLSDRPRRGTPAGEPPPLGFLRDVRFQGIRATVVSEGRQYPDMSFRQNYRPGETRQAIVLNAIGDVFLKDVSFQDVHVTFGGGGTAEEARRDVPQVAGEYFEIGTPPAYGLFARNVRGLALHNVRFDVENSDLRPAILLDHVTGAVLNALAVDGNPQAQTALRFIETKDVLVTAPRLLTPAAAFLEVDGAASQTITLDGGDVSKAPSAVVFAGGAARQAVKVRA